MKMGKHLKSKSVQKAKKYHSISFWIWMSVLLIIIPVITTITYVNMRIRKNLYEQAAKVNGDMLGLYMMQIDEMLMDVDTYLSGMLASNQNIVDLQVKTNTNDRQITKFAMRQDLTTASISKQKMNGFFIYSCSQKVDDNFFNCVSNASDTEALDSDRIKKKLLMKINENDLDTNHWFYWKMGNDNYLFRVLYDRDTYLGCWVVLNDLLQPLETINLGDEGFSVLASEYGQILTENPTNIKMIDLTDNIQDVTSYSDTRFEQPETMSLTYSLQEYQQKYIQISAQSKSTDLYLVAMIPNDNILGDYKHVQKVLLVLSLIILIILPVSAWLVLRFIYKPLYRVTNTMIQVKDGDIEVRVADDSSLKEIHILSSRFNEMLDEINNLKIHMYEQQLKEKETYLQYLQLQIHPHFFLNCMSLMHGLAELEKYKEIQKLSTYLVKYFRYMFKKATTLIHIPEEMQHIRNYMEIQKIRFPDRIDYQINVDEGLEKVLIPPLSVQSFVENSIKYAMDLTRKTEIKVDIVRLGENLKVSIRDNGKGYPVDILTAINSDEDLFEGDTHGIGIRNVKERLRLIFGENVYIHFYNDQGSVVEYVIPVMEEA